MKKRGDSTSKHCLDLGSLDPCADSADRFVGQRWAPSESVTFRELIPRGNNTLVAAHAFTHVLALASVSAFRVRQAAPYDDIYIDRF